MIPLNQLFLKGEEFWSKKKRSFRNPLNFMDRWIEICMWHVEFEDLNYIRLRPHIGCSPRSSFLRPVHHLCPNQNRWIHCIATLLFFPVQLFTRASALMYALFVYLHDIWQYPLARTEEKYQCMQSWPHSRAHRWWLALEGFCIISVGMLTTRAEHYGSSNFE